MHLTFKTFLLVVLFFQSYSYANDSFIAQRQTSLSEDSKFYDTSGKRHRVVTFIKPTDSHFFTYTENSVYMNHVADKRKNLRVITFDREQYNILPFQKKPDTPLSWSLSDIQAILKRDKEILKKEKFENGRVLLFDLKRQCGMVRIFADRNKEGEIKKYYVDFENIGVMETYYAIEGVTCDASSVTVGTLSCATERGPCNQLLFSAQYRNVEGMLSEIEILQKIYGSIDSKYKLSSIRYGENKYASLSLTRYIELLNRRLLYVVTTITEQPGDEFICGACERTLIVSVFEMSDKGWDLVGTSKPYSIAAFANPQVHMQKIGDNSAGIIISYLYGRQGENTINHKVYKIDATKVEEVLGYSHFYILGFNCEYPKRPYSELEFLPAGDVWDIRIKSGHYINNGSCKSAVFSKEETYYKYKDGTYQLNNTDATEHTGNY